MAERREQDDGLVRGACCEDGPRAPDDEDERADQLADRFSPPASFRAARLAPRRSGAIYGSLFD